MKKSILILDDNSTICLMLKSWLVKRDFKVESATNVEEAKRMIRNYPFDLILSDIRMPEADGFSLLNWVKKFDSDILVIMMTGYAEIESVVEAMKSGAADYITKPIDPEVLFCKIDEAFLLQKNHKNSNPLFNNFLLPPGDLYSKLLNRLNYTVENNHHLIITGDRGTGKSSCVKFIYEKGIHNSKPLVILDADEFENNTLYGDRKNESLLTEKFKTAKGGLLYVRSVDKLNKILQNELLNFIFKQSKDEDFTQVILSSKNNTEELQNILIPKLFYQLEKNIISLPSLNGNKEHILFFASHFLEFANYILDKKVESIDPDMQEKLISHDWSGNIQELKNLVIKAVLLTDGKTITKDIAVDLFGNGKSISDTSKILNVDSLRKENYEKEKIYQALKLSKGNKTMAASILNIDRKTLYNKIKLYNVTF